MVYAKKTFGQNFLKNKQAIEKIITAGDITPGETVVEIGPGQGALTGYLLSAGAQVVAIEIDPDMIIVLQEKFDKEIAEGQLQIHQGDVLETSLDEFGLKDKRFKVIANIPYYITGAILRRFLESDIQPSDMVLLVQKEVAERIVDGQQSTSKKSKKLKTDKENILSLSVKIFGDVRYVTTVSASSFSPAPRVDSAVISISNISHQKLEQAGIRAKDFFVVIKAGFAQKRKTLVNNLKHAGYDSRRVLQALVDSGIQERARAETVTLDQWTKLVSFLT